MRLRLIENINPESNEVFYTIQYKKNWYCFWNHLMGVCRDLDHPNRLEAIQTIEDLEQARFIYKVISEKYSYYRGGYFIIPIFEWKGRDENEDRIWTNEYKFAVVKHDITDYHLFDGKHILKDTEDEAKRYIDAILNKSGKPYTRVIEK